MTTKKSDMIIPSKKHVFLEGPKSRGYELFFAIKVFVQFMKGFMILHSTKPSITVFGSARFKSDHIYYKKAEEFGKAIASLGFATMTGGGPGIMEAANKGAYENGGQSIGLNIRLPFEQHANPYLHKSITFEHFFVRKVLLVKYSYAFIILPGGFGTMDEFFETITLIQTKTVTSFPIVLFGKEFYADLIEAIQDMAEKGTISQEDLNLVLFTDDINEAIDHIRKYITDNYQVRNRGPWPWLLEKR